MMKNEDKRNKYQLEAWKRKAGPLDDQDIKTNSKKLRKSNREEVEEALQEYEEYLEDELHWDDFDYLEETREQERLGWQAIDQMLDNDYWLSNEVGLMEFIPDPEFPVYLPADEEEISEE